MISVEYKQSLLFGEVRRAIKKKKFKKLVLAPLRALGLRRLTPRIPCGALASIFFSFFWLLVVYDFCYYCYQYEDLVNNLPLCFVQRTMLLHLSHRFPNEDGPDLLEMKSYNCWR